ncbi:MAG: gliding motility-associated protein GldE [Paludibacteraceae bacterium]|nr:gliding motility-associated protein GldE [Paludibacteraceae bacterium]
MIPLIILTILLLVASSLASGSEVAFFSLEPKDKDEMEESDSLADHQIKELLKKPQNLLATILITNNFVNVAVIVISSIIINKAFDFSDSPIIGFIVETILITFLILLVGEIIPKIYARQHALTTCRNAAPIMCLLMIIMKPFAYILVHSTSFIDKKIEKYRHNTLSMDELSHALELTEESINEDKDILQGIVKFGSQTAASVMTPRMDMITLQSNDSFEKVIDCINEHEYSRIPVMNGTYDNIRGILYAKDLIPFIGKPATFKWQTLIRQAHFVPETKKIDDLLQEFQKERVHMAIVVDEFGGTSGLVTLEDVLEEVVGDISDEYDQDTKMYKVLDKNSYIFEAKISLADLIRATDIDDEIFDDTEDADTLAGLILEIKGEFPALNEHITYKNLDFEILEADARRINKVKLAIQR